MIQEYLQEQNKHNHHEEISKSSHILVAQLHRLLEVH